MAKAAPGLPAAQHGHVQDALYPRTRGAQGAREEPDRGDQRENRPEGRDTVGYDAGSATSSPTPSTSCSGSRSTGAQLRDGAALVLVRITRRLPFLERFFADTGYQRPRVGEAAPRPAEIIRSDVGFVAQPKRWIVERTFASVGINPASPATANASPKPPSRFSRPPRSSSLVHPPNWKACAGWCEASASGGPPRRPVQLVKEWPA